MAITKFTPPQVPFQASDHLRAYLDEQMQSIAPLLNNAAQRNEDEIIEGDWTFSGAVLITNGSLHLSHSQDVLITLEADTDNVSEDHNPAIKFLQDGGLDRKSVV